MKRFVAAVAAAALIVGLTWRAPAPRTANATAEALEAARAVALQLSPAEKAEAIEPGVLVVDLVDGTSAFEIAEIEARLGIDLEPVSPMSASDGIETARVVPGRERGVLDALARDPKVEVAEPSYIYKALYQPNDPRFKEQWHMTMIKAPEAWDITAGQGVTVAVIDTGIAYESHGAFYQVEDLAGVEFVAPFNFVSRERHANDDHGHGTHVAGTIAQATNNAIGVAGVANKARLMPLKVLDGQGRGAIGPIAQAIRWAADKGAKVINMSLGGPFPSRVLESACEYAKGKGVLVVCAAGNDGREKLSYPAAYAACVSVSAVRPDGNLSWYSNYGKGLTIAAPGGDTRWGGASAGVLQNCINPSNISEQGYYTFQGTSMAAPHVAGAAALVMSMGVTDPGQAIKILCETAQRKDDVRRFGAGIVDCEAAVKKARKDQRQPLVLALALGLLSLAPLGARLLLRTLAKSGPGLALGLLAGACGLIGLPGLAGTPVPAWSVSLLGAEHHQTALAFSALVPLLGVVLLSGVSRLRGVLAGFALGVAAYLAVAAFTLAPSFTCGSWMVTQALFLSVLGGLVLRRQSRDERQN